MYVLYTYQFSLAGNMYPKNVGAPLEMICAPKVPPQWRRPSAASFDLSSNRHLSLKLGDDDATKILTANCSEVLCSMVLGMK